MDKLSTTNSGPNFDIIDVQGCMSSSSPEPTPGG